MADVRAPRHLGVLPTGRAAATATSPVPAAEPPTEWGRWPDPVGRTPPGTGRKPPAALAPG
ncbi:hypothetical protein, partial [Streptomyces sp. NPDC055005]